MSINVKCRKAKPIFDEEREFIENHLPNVKIPNDCWITGGDTKYIWLDPYCEKYFLKFKVDGWGNFTIVKDNRELLSDYKQVPMKQVIGNEKERIMGQYENAVTQTADFIKEHTDTPYTVSVSGGKDSELLVSVWEKSIEKANVHIQWQYIFLNTSNEVAEVYRRIKQIPNIKIINPKIGWYQWIKNENYVLPTINKRSCCSTYKEGQIKQLFDKNSSLIQVMGVRNKESTKRAKYDFYIDYEFDKNVLESSNYSKKWSKLAPIVNFETIDVWIAIMILNLPINIRYKYGESRVGCLFCPYTSNYSDEIIRNEYPKMYERFVNLCEKSYKNRTIIQVLYTEDEFIHGGWKHVFHKINNVIVKGKNVKTIKQVADIMGISENMAEKYFIKNCECGNKLTALQIGMYYKTFGRFEGQEDNRIPLCQKCFCEKTGMTKTEYYQKILDYKQGGCNLF